MELRRAEIADLDGVLTLISQAKAHLKRLGVDQWQGPYPDRAALLRDLNAGAGHVLTDGALTAGYLCLSFGGEPSYGEIDGAWLSLQPYAVIHRLTVGDAWRGRGLTGRIFRYAEALCAEKGVHSLKLDTHRQNAAMRRVVERGGFTCCGTVRLPDGERLAFEKLL